MKPEDAFNNNESMYDKLFESLLNIQKHNEPEVDDKQATDDIMKNLVDAVNRWNETQAEKARIEEEKKLAAERKKKKDQERREKEDGKLAAAVDIVRAIDKFMCEYCPEISGQEPLSEHSLEVSARTLLMLLDKGLINGFDDLF